MIELILTGLFGAIGGGGLVKVYDIYYKNKFDTRVSTSEFESNIREELRADILSLRGYVERLEKELRESRQEAMLFAAKNAELEYRANLFEAQAKEYKTKADKNEYEVERLRLLIDKMKK
jgi:signal transduction histidine kinase